MKRTLILAAALILIMSLAACGPTGEETPTAAQTTGDDASHVQTEENDSGSPASTDSAAEPETSSVPEEPEPEPEPAAVQRDTKEDYWYEYPEDILLLEDEYVRITAKSLSYRESKQSASGMQLNFGLEVKNKTDAELTIEHKTDYAQSLQGNDSLEIWYSADEWNGWVGETDDCFQKTCRINIKKRGEKGGYETLDAVRFDWYVSEDSPFFNVITGPEKVAAAVQAAELAELSALTPLHHAENEMLSVDIVKAEAAYGSYKVTYIATNTSSSPLYVLPQADSTNGQTDWKLYNGFWKYAIAYGPGESWYRTESYRAERAFADGPAELAVTAYNAIRQIVAEMTFAVTAPETFPAEATETAELKYADADSIARADLAAAYTDVKDLKPFYTVENEALRLDLLTMYTEYSAEHDRYTGKTVYALTNLTGQELYYYNGYEMTAFASGETAFGTIDTGYSDNGYEGTVSRSLEAKTSKDGGQTAASVGFRCNWTLDAETKEIGASGFSEYRNRADKDVLSGDAVYYLYSNVVLAENEYCRIELRTMNGRKNEDGTWEVDAEFYVYNTYTEKYLLYDPGKISSDWLPYLDWIEPEKSDNFTLRFTAQGTEPDVIGSVSFDVNGWIMNGLYASGLFESTLNAALRLSHADPVVSGEIVNK